MIGFAESLAAIETAWMLLEGGYEVVAFTRAGNRSGLSKERRLVIRGITSPQHDWSAAVAELLSLVAGLDPIAVMPLDDDALWLIDRASRHPGFPPVAGPVGHAAVIALDKREQLRIAAECGIAVPPTVEVDLGSHRTASACWDADNSVVPGAPGPWIVKPALAVVERDGALHRGHATVARTVADIRSAALAAGEPMLVQPVLHGVGEGVFGHAQPSGVVAWSGHRRIRMMNPNGSGSSACRSIDPEPSLLSPAQGFLSATAWRGLFMLEYLRDSSGQPWLMELNGRAWGSIALARHRGLPYPVWAVQQAVDPEFTVADVAPGPHLIARHLGRELVHLAFLVRGRPSHPEWPSVRSGFWAVLTWRRGERFYNLRRNSLGVFVADTFATVATQVSAFRRGRLARGAASKVTPA